MRLACTLHPPCCCSPQSCAFPPGCGFGSSRSTQPRTHACCSNKSCAEQAAQGTATCLSTWSRRQQPFRASRERQCEEQLWYQPAWPVIPMLSRGMARVRKFPALLGAGGGILCYWKRGAQVLTHVTPACKQRLKVRRGFLIQAVCWKHCPPRCRGRLEGEVTLRNTWEGGLQCRECCTHTLLWAAPSPGHSQHAAGGSRGSHPQPEGTPSSKGSEENTKTHPVLPTVNHYNSVSMQRVKSNG